MFFLSVFLFFLSVFLSFITFSLHLFYFLSFFPSFSCLRSLSLSLSLVWLSRLSLSLSLSLYLALAILCTLATSLCTGILGVPKPEGLLQHGPRGPYGSFFGSFHARGPGSGVRRLTISAVRGVFLICCCKQELPWLHSDKALGSYNVQVPNFFLFTIGSYSCS